MIDFYLEHDKFVNCNVLTIKLSKEEKLETHKGNYVFVWNDSEMPRSLYSLLGDYAKGYKYIPSSLLRVSKEGEEGYLVDDAKIRGLQINQTNKDIFELIIKVL